MYLQMDTTTKQSSESVETRANRLQCQRAREKSGCASEPTEQREESLRKRRMRDRIKWAAHTAEQREQREAMLLRKQLAFP